MANGAEPFGAAVTEMLALLDDFVPAPAPPLPDAAISVASISERSVGLGGLRGLEFRDQFGVAELKAVRLDALVRYDVWGGSPIAATQAATTLNTGLFGARDTLRGEGVLKLSLDGVEPPDFASPLNAWRVGARYRVLYEFPYQDTGGAESLIASVPIDFDPEQAGGPTEQTLVTDELTRWDDNAAPALVVAGRFGVGGISVLSWFAAAGPSGAVSVTRTFSGASGPPDGFASLDAFLDAVSGPDPVSRHATVNFATLVDFVAAIGSAGVPIALGDWNGDGVTDLFVPRSRTVLPLIQLATAADRLEIAYGDAAFDQPGIVYLRATRG
jgi:hypothetical protein